MQTGGFLSTLSLETFFDSKTFTLTYVIFDSTSKDAIIIDPVLDYDKASSITSGQSVDEVSKYIKSKGIDFLSDLKAEYGSSNIA